jgi:hypothetical protein
MGARGAKCDLDDALWGEPHALLQQVLVFLSLSLVVVVECWGTVGGAMTAAGAGAGALNAWLVLAGEIVVALGGRESYCCWSSSAAAVSAL